MSEGSDSFNATGPTLVAFETTSADVPVLQQFGVSVVGTNCGVYGQGTDGDQKDRHRAPAATGVFGRGDTHGVYGISGSVDDEVPSRFVLEFDWRGFRLDEDTWSGSKVNRLIGECLGQALPSVHFAHRDLT